MPPLIIFYFYFFKKLLLLIVAFWFLQYYSTTHSLSFGPFPLPPYIFFSPCQKQLNSYTMANSHNATSTKSCFSGILRRLLCTGSLPTPPSDSDHLPEFDKMDFINYVQKNHDHEVKGGGTPGVVARLMGLDSLPADTTWVPIKDSIYFRSRSVNSADYSSPFDLAAHESYHRRVRTSVSFREIPTTFLVCFDGNGDDQKTNADQGLKIMAAQVAGSADQVKRNTGKTKTSTNITSGNKSNTKESVVVVKKKENRENNKKKDVEGKRNSLREVENNVLVQKKSNDVYVKSSVKMKRSAKPVNLSTEAKVSDGMKRAKERVNRRNRAKKVEPEPEPVSSPDSVAIISGTRAFNPAKKNSTPKVVDKYFDYPCVNSVRKSNAGDDDDDQEVRRAIHITKSEKLMRRREIEFYMDKLVEVCRLTDEDTKVSPNNWPWISSRSDQVIEFEDFQGICFDFGQEILRVLVQQVVDELCKQTVQSFLF